MDGLREAKIEELYNQCIKEKRYSVARELVKISRDEGLKERHALFCIEKKIDLFFADEMAITPELQMKFFEVLILSNEWEDTALSFAKKIGTQEVKERVLAKAIKSKSLGYVSSAIKLCQRKLTQEERAKVLPKKVSKDNRANALAWAELVGAGEKYWNHLFDLCIEEADAYDLKSAMKTSGLALSEKQKQRLVELVNPIHAPSLIACGLSKKEFKASLKSYRAKGRSDLAFTLSMQEGVGIDKEAKERLLVKALLEHAPYGYGYNGSEQSRTIVNRIREYIKKHGLALKMQISIFEQEQRQLKRDGRKFPYCIYTLIGCGAVDQSLINRFFEVVGKLGNKEIAWALADLQESKEIWKNELEQAITMGWLTRAQMIAKDKFGRELAKEEIERMFENAIVRADKYEIDKLVSLLGRELTLEEKQRIVAILLKEKKFSEVLRHISPEFEQSFKEEIINQCVKNDEAWILKQIFEVFYP